MGWLCATSAATMPAARFLGGGTSEYFAYCLYCMYWSRIVCVMRDIYQQRMLLVGELGGRWDESQRPYIFTLYWYICYVVHVLFISPCHFCFIRLNLQLGAHRREDPQDWKFQALPSFGSCRPDGGTRRRENRTIPQRPSHHAAMPLVSKRWRRCSEGGLWRAVRGSIRQGGRGTVR